MALDTKKSEISVSGFVTTVEGSSSPEIKRDLSERIDALRVLAEQDQDALSVILKDAADHLESLENKNGKKGFKGIHLFTDKKDRLFKEQIKTFNDKIEFDDDLAMDLMDPKFNANWNRLLADCVMHGNSESLDEETYKMLSGIAGRDATGQIC